MSAATTAAPAGSASPAGLWRRTAALCYDLLLVAGILMTTSFVLIAARAGAAVPVGSLLYRLFLVAQVAAFFLVFWCRGGQTLGMRSWGIRVETEAGTALDGRRAALRFAAGLLSLASLGLGFFWIVVDPDCKAWHDRLSGTRVVRLPAADA